MIRQELIERYFLNIQPDNESLQVYVPRKAILAAVKECAPQLKGDLLDIGCGQMPYRELILDLNKNVKRYIGLDLEVSSIHDTSIADLFWNGESIPLENNAVDSAMATEVLEHSFSPDQTVKEIHRVLKPGGLFFFTIPFIWPLHEVPYDAYRYTPFSLRMHLEKAGFENIKLFSLGGWNASLAQLLGLWLTESKPVGFRKKVLTKLIKRAIPYLLKHDVKDNSFGHHCMITGLYGTAVKKAIP
jgi:SAM-dependent methyltransferase